MTRWSMVLALGASLTALAGPSLAENIRVPVATLPTPRPHERISDPLEGFNRGMFAVDKRINRVFGRGKVAGSAGVIPQPVRHGLFNFFNNLDEPSSFANDALQLKFGKAAVAAGRFATNSTVGVFGTFDVATKFGLRRHREDLGQTLAKYGVKAGPYIYLPIFGPSTLRDKVGAQVDGMTTPLGFVNAGMVGGQAVSATRRVVQPQLVGVREKASAAAADGETKDEYATLRELYYEQRADQIADAPGTDDLIPTPLPPPLPAYGVQQASRPARGSLAQQPLAAGDYRHMRHRPRQGGEVAAADSPKTAEEAQPLSDQAEEAAQAAAYDAAHPPAPPAQEAAGQRGRRFMPSRR